MIRVVAPFHIEAGIVRRALSVYIDPENLPEALRSDLTSSLLLYDNNGEVLLRSATSSADGDLVTESRVPASLLFFSHGSPLASGQITLQHGDDRT